MVGDCGEMACAPLVEPEAAPADGAGGGSGADGGGCGEIRSEPGDVCCGDGGEVVRPWESCEEAAMVSRGSDITVLRGSNSPVTSGTKSRDIAFVGASSSSCAVSTRTVSCPTSTA